jgi:hypothetical protein
MTIAYSIQQPRLNPLLRVEKLMIVRQSSAQALEDLFTLLERTLYLYPDLLGWDEIYGRGIDPILKPDPEDHYQTLPSHGRACLYQVGDTWVLLILGSAAAPNEVGFELDGHENAVVNLITDVVRRLRPRQVLAGPFDRIVRSLHFAERPTRLSRSQVSKSSITRTQMESTRFGSPATTRTTSSSISLGPRMPT